MTNEMIAEKVFGWEKNKRWPWIWMLPDGPTSHNASQNKIPDFLNDHNAAMMVVEKMRVEGWSFDAQTCDGSWFANFRSEIDPVDHEVGWHVDNFCFAICAAALNAKGK